jgi:hypothetical protein
MQESKSNMGKKIIGTDYGQQNHTPHTHPIAKTHIWLPIGSLVLKKYSIIIDFGYHQIF